MKSSIGNRITVSSQNRETIVRIAGSIEPWMNHALLGWLIMWSAIGVYVVYYIATKDLSTNEFFFFLTYVAFWLYFEIKAVYSWLFRTYGFELIKITPEELYIKRYLFGYGKATRYDRENVKDLRKVEVDRKSLGGAYNKSFWVIGNEQIQFDFIGKEIGFAMHLEEKDRNELLVQLRRFLKRK